LEIEDFRIIGQVNKINRRINKKETKVESKTGKNKRKAFTIIELLTVMSIIVILFGLLVPSMNMVRRHSKHVKQNAQFHSITAALEMYKNDFEDYPESKAKENNGAGTIDYCGAMKLCEAMVGQDLLGFHPESVFKADGKTADGGKDLYPSPFNMTIPEHVDNLRSRKGPYLPVDSANVYKLSSLYGQDANSVFPNADRVICDEYSRLRDIGTGKKAGTPVLYYRADITKTSHSITDLNKNIYNREDNQELVDLKLPWEPASNHPIATTGTDPEGKTANPDKFYEITRDEKITSMTRPMRSDSYILISAGFDGLYGTRDDVFNFGNK
jgi:prepilin-type N-terminal cleavage/methylation domain-containing protein